MENSLGAFHSVTQIECRSIFLGIQWVTKIEGYCVDLCHQMHPLST